MTNSELLLIVPEKDSCQKIVIYVHCMYIREKIDKESNTDI